MQFVEIFIRQNPWTEARALIGLVAEDSTTGQLRVIDAFSSTDLGSVLINRARRALGRVVVGRSTRIERDKRDRTAKAFLHSLQVASQSLSSQRNSAPLDALLKCIADRGTSCCFSSIQSGDFESDAEAFRFCLDRETARAQSLRQTAPIAVPTLQRT